jgi:hypothetical protein
MLEAQIIGAATGRAGALMFVAGVV